MAAHSEIWTKTSESAALVPFKGLSEVERDGAFVLIERVVEATVDSNVISAAVLDDSRHITLNHHA